MSIHGPALAGLGLAVILAAPVPKAPVRTEAEVRKKLDGSWRVVGWERPGDESPRGNDWIEWEFDKDRACQSYDTGQVEQFKYAIKLDVTRDPMHLDLVFDTGKEQRVIPGIFRFDGGDLIWVQGHEVAVEVLKAEPPAGSVRPNTFTPKAPRSWTRLTLRRGETRYGRP
jgi:uncharacterized protein (TIGR03067 family)